MPTISDVISKYKKEAVLTRRLTNNGFEWIGLCLKPLLEDLRSIGYHHSFLYGELKGHRCVTFLTKGLEG